MTEFYLFFYSQPSQPESVFSILNIVCSATLYLLSYLSL